MSGFKDLEGATNEVPDNSCVVESGGSFGSLGVNFLSNDLSQDEDSTAAEESDGRWNIPFDDENEDALRRTKCI